MVYVVSFYGDTYSVHNTITWIDQIIAHCFQAGYPFLIGGDFNTDPMTLQEQLGASPRIKHEVQILAPNTPTCVMQDSESIIDYWIAGGGMHRLVQKVQTDLSVPIKTHHAVRLTLRTEGRHTEGGLQWSRPSRGSSTQVIGPHRLYQHDWAQLDSQLQRAKALIQSTPAERIRDLTPHEAIDTALDEIWGTFQHTVKQEVQNRFGVDGKAGAPFHFKPCRSGDPQCLRHRPFVHRYIGWQRRMVQVAGKWPITSAGRQALLRMPSCDPKLAMTHTMLEWHYTWQRWWTHLAQLVLDPRYRGHLAVPLAQWGVDLGTLESEMMGHERAMKTTGIQQWKDSMFTGAGTPVHQWSKKCKVAVIEQAPTSSGHVSSNPIDILAHTTQVWSKIWQAESSPPTIFQLLPAPTTELPALTIDDITRAAARFKRGTAVPDGWHPGHFGRLANTADIQKFIDVLHICESAGRLPPSAKAAVVKMIPKPRGGHRPIALFKAMFRLWGKARTKLLAGWATSLCSATFTMSPTRRITDGIFRELVRSLLAQAKQNRSSKFTWTSRNSSITCADFR
jgi:hypothetical protein